MKSLPLIFLFFLQTYISASAQPANDQRTASTKIADLLATMPASNKEQLNKNMQTIADLGEKGIVSIISMLSAPGAGDNTSVQYAIGGFSFYVIQPGKEPQRQIAVKSYGTALEKVQDNTNKQFIISQLQLIGKDDAVPFLQKYLSDEKLSGPAARALAQINTPNAQKVLFNSLSNAGSDVILLSIIEALGYVRYKPAVPILISLAETSEGEERKVILYALARTGDPAAKTLLQSAAQNAHYSFDNTEATASYIVYLQQLAINGKKAEADILNKKLLKDATVNNQLQTRIAALKLSVDLNREKALPLLYSSMQDKNIKYRAAALQFAERFQNAATDQQWVKLIGKVSPEAQVQIIEFLGKSQDKNILNALKPFLADKNEEVRIATITGIAKIGQQRSLPLLLNHVKKENANELAASENALLQMPGDSVALIISNKLPEMPPSGKVVLMNVLAARGASFAINRIVDELNSSDTATHNAAVRALSTISTRKDLPGLFSLLNKSQGADTYFFQQAIIHALADVNDTLARAKLVREQMYAQVKDKQWLYYDLLANLGGNESLSALQSAFEDGNGQTKNAAVAALSKVSGMNAARILFHISSSDKTFRDIALAGYIDNIRKSSYPPDQKILMLEDAMELAQTNTQRQEILDEAANSKTFLSMVFAGKYLDDPALQQNAAMSVMNVALSNKAFSGDMVRGLLNKTIEVIKGRDAEYQKQAISKFLFEMPPGDGFVALFNGKDLTGWKGLVGNPIERAKMNRDTLAKKQKRADEVMRDGWSARDGLLIFSGHGENLCTQKLYGDFEMYVDWKITKDGDAGIYLRGSPQVQIWDTSRVDVGAQVGSGGLYNNQKNQSKPLVLADNAIGEWNTFHIIMKGDKVTVYLNGKLVTDNVALENYWDRNLPIFPKEQIELQAHGTYVAYRNIYLKELGGSEAFQLSDEEKKEGFKILFDGTSLDKWTGNKTDYKPDNGELLVNLSSENHGNLFTNEEFGDFVFRFEFQLTPGANNGLGIRAPLEGDIAYTGMELQILDNEASIYKDLHPYQYHGSVYGVIPAKRGFLKPVGEWNYEEVIAKGSRIKVILNGETIVDGDIDEASKNGTMDQKEHPGLKRKSGHIGFLGHGSIVRFRNIRVKEL
jgi:HEAT repeat protein